MSFIDISVPVHVNLPCWPGAAPTDLSRRLSIPLGSKVNSSVLTMDVHTGTHVDAPLHYFERAADAASLPLDAFIGAVQVVEIFGQGPITDRELQAVVADHVERVLLKTRNSQLWRTTEFEPAFVGLTEEAALWIVNRGLRLIGIDYLSIQPYNGTHGVHETLIEGGVVILEGLDLTHVDQGKYELICLPLKLPEADGAPARAILRLPDAEGSEHVIR